MKQTLVLSALVLGIAGCGDSSDTDSGTADMAVAVVHDMAVTPPDMTVILDLNFPRVAVGGTVVSYMMQQVPLAGVKVCVYPSTTDCVTTGQDGAYTLMVAATGPSGIAFSKDGYLSGMQEITTPVPAPVNFILIDNGTAIGLAAFVGANIEETSGLFAIGAVDPQGAPLAGVVFTAAPKAGMGPFYFGNNGFPDPQATSTGADGRGIWAQVAPGDYSISATLTGKTCVPAPPAAWAGTDQLHAKATAVAATLTALGMVCQ